MPEQGTARSLLIQHVKSTHTAHEHVVFCSFNNEKDKKQNAPIIVADIGVIDSIYQILINVLLL